MTAVPLGFLPKPILVDLHNLLASRKMVEAIEQTRKYKQIRASIQEVDLIEPLSVGAVDRRSGQHLLLDGHIRHLILKELGYTQAPCLVATDDESYTYNNRVNRISTIQEHVMIRRAAERGLSVERLAKALCTDVDHIVKKVNLLVGICPEAIEMLKDRQCSVDVFTALRRMKPIRQLESAELMLSANNVTVAYARALLAASAPERLTDPSKPVVKGVSQEQLGRMQREMSNLRERYKMAEQTYGEDTLNLVLARGYVCKLIDNKQVLKYLEQHEAAVLEQFIGIARVERAEL